MAKDYQFQLSQPESQTYLWKKTQAHFQIMLERERKKNDSSVSIEETERTRGKISILKELIKLNEVYVEPVAETD
jgi:hypothetical protein